MYMPYNAYTATTAATIRISPGILVSVVAVVKVEAESDDSRGETGYVERNSRRVGKADRALVFSQDSIAPASFLALHP
jgi:hypothetical protein